MLVPALVARCGLLDVGAILRLFIADIVIVDIIRASRSSPSLSLFVEDVVEGKQKGG
jgi:hypothetical protein